MRTYLQGLTLAAILPLAAFAIIVAYLTLERERETVSQGAQARALTLLTAIEAEMHSSIEALELLASVPDLTLDDLQRFRFIATAALESQLDWLNIDLATPEGQQLMNLRVAEHKPLPRIDINASRLDALIREQEPVVGDMMLNPLLGRWTYAVRVPVIRDGVVRFILSANVSPESIGRIIGAQGFEWTAVVVDSNARIVARNREPEKYVGELASQTLRDALARGPSGWFEGKTLEGASVYSPWWRSQRYGWAVSMGIPTSEINATSWRAAWLIAAGLLIAIALSFLLARIFARRISRPMDELVAVTSSIGQGKLADFSARMPIRELRVLRRALRKAETAVRERQQELLTADRAKDQFLAVLGHELRNPLAALTAAAHVLKTAPQGEAAERARGVLERQTRQMTRLIEDLLDVSRISMGKALLERTVFDLTQLVEEGVNSLRQSSKHPIALSLPGGPLFVDADRARIEQILSNLVGNAQKFSRPGGRISVALSAEGGAAVLRISDNGVGIARDELGRIFDLFVQGEHGPDRTKSGLGLGLALVKRLAQMHGGTVEAASEGAGRGASFTVRLPIAGATAQPVAESPALSPSARRVLVVDDNEDVRKMILAMLSLDGHELHGASDGTSGLAAAERHPPDVALIDIGLPDMDGYEVARQLRSRAKDHIKLIALTGYGQPEDQRKARDAGFDAHLTKPVRIEQLTRAIAETR